MQISSLLAPSSFKVYTPFSSEASAGALLTFLMAQQLLDSVKAYAREEKRMVKMNADFILLVPAQWAVATFCRAVQGEYEESIRPTSIKMVSLFFFKEAK